ncbi:MAG TPA: glycoside hydrolase family 88 protein [Lacipirellulaceae bacterium]
MLKRRDFLWASTAAVGAAGWAVTTPATGARAESAASESDEVIDRVKHAMLTMQRASWEQGVAAQAYLELGDYDTVYLLAKEMALRQLPDGRLGVVYSDGGSTDGAMGGEALVDAARRTSDPELQSAIERELEYVLHKCPCSSDGTLYHRTGSPELWIDSMNTTPPFLAAVGKYDEALQQIRGLRTALWDTGAKLYHHQWHAGRKEFTSAKYWGVGNGWAASAIARVIGMLPDSESKSRAELIGYGTEVFKGCLAHRRSDGLFHNNVDEPDTFIETNLSQMLAYTIYRGVQADWLPRDYLTTADEMRAAARRKVDEHGYVQDVCGAPAFNKPGRATEGQSFFLRMEAARRDCAAAG